MVLTLTAAALNAGSTVTVILHDLATLQRTMQQALVDSTSGSQNRTLQYSNLPCAHPGGGSGNARIHNPTALY